jgi:hypothetical protein
MAEAINVLYKPDPIRTRGPWRTVDQVELATLEYVWWCNNQRLHSELDYRRPVQAEDDYYADPESLLESDRFPRENLGTKPTAIHTSQESLVWEQCWCDGCGSGPRCPGLVVAWAGGAGWECTQVVSYTRQDIVEAGHVSRREMTEKLLLNEGDVAG